jgi:hypothetical protein
MSKHSATKRTTETMSSCHMNWRIVGRRGVKRWLYLAWTTVFRTSKFLHCTASLYSPKLPETENSAAGLQKAGRPDRTQEYLTDRDIPKWTKHKTSSESTRLTIYLQFLFVGQATSSDEECPVSGGGDRRPVPCRRRR